MRLDIAHRLLSQRAAQHDAILATLALPGTSTDPAERPERRLVEVHPQLHAVLRRDRGERWTDAALGAVDAARGRYALVPHAEPSDHALVADAARMVP